MKPWERFSLFCNAERNGRYRASLPVVEVDRREEWAFRALDYWIRKAYGPDWRKQIPSSFHCVAIAIVASNKLPQSGGMYYQ